MLRTQPLRWWGAALAMTVGSSLVMAGILSGAVTVQAQAPADAAFKSMLPTLQHPRCANCHGVLDVFAPGTTHGGGQMSPPTELAPNGSGCTDCHVTPLPDGNDWRQPRQGTVARWGGQSPAQICRGIKAGRASAPEIVEHAKVDGAVVLGFAGKRGGATVKADPPPMTQAQFVAASQQWVNAMGADKWSDPNAGCPAQLSGAWNSDYGVATLVQTGNAVSGTINYTNGNTGQLTGTLDGQTLSYTWSNAADNGDGSLSLSSNGCVLDGYFNQATDGTSGSWTLTLNQCGGAPSAPPA